MSCCRVLKSSSVSSTSSGEDLQTKQAVALEIRVRIFLTGKTVGMTETVPWTESSMNWFVLLGALMRLLSLWYLKVQGLESEMLLSSVGI